jgi:L-ascorbate metabolism protein UlaG (beta-lactamase superfamily)
MAENIFTWCGHSAFRIETSGGKAIYIDPFLSANPACPPTLRKVERCDVIALTHGHADHLGDTYAIYAALRPKIVCIYDLCPLLQRHGVAGEDCAGMNIGGTVELHGMRFMQTPATHSASADDGGVSIYGGEPAGYVIELEDGFRFYHAGDTWVMMDMDLIGKLMKPQVAFLPIGGHFTMDPAAAALAAKMLGVKRVVPMHYGTFPILAGTPEDLQAELAGTGIDVLAVEPGVEFTLP